MPHRDSVKLITRHWHEFPKSKPLWEHAANYVLANVLEFFSPEAHEYLDAPHHRPHRMLGLGLLTALILYAPMT